MAIKNRKYSMFSFITIPFETSPLLLVSFVLLKIIYSIIPTISIIANAQFIDSSINYFNKKAQSTDVWRSICIVVMLFCLKVICREVNTLLSKKLYLALNRNLEAFILEKKSRLSYINIEDSSSWNLIVRIQENVAQRFLEGFDNLMFLFSLAIEIIGFGLILLDSAWWIDIILIMIAIPLIRISIVGGKKEYNVTKILTEKSRFLKYISQILTSRDEANERYLYDYSNKVIDYWTEEYSDVVQKKIKEHKIWFIRMKAMGVVINLTSFILMGCLLPWIQKGNLSIGTFIAIVNAILGLTQSITWDLSDAISQLSDQKEYINDFSAFVNLDEDNADIQSSMKISKFESLEFEDVWFSYPGSTEPVLRGVSFNITKGKQYAFVGLNGAGKTTIIKLIMKLYTPDRGKILLNRKDLSEYSLSDLRNTISILFQDFAKYQLKIKDNILLGRKSNQDRLKYIVNECELTEVLNSLKDGIDTNLGKIYEEGVDISGGEWQKLALARTLFMNADVVILDEPTAALDAIAENVIYEKYSKLFKNKTIIMISHRLASTKLADIIYVLYDGKIIEKGSHLQLMKILNGKYSEMFQSQKEWYYENE